ncbi:MAG: AsmA-like C-terminal region-containing protein [Opitutales bacterium]
MKNLIKLCSQGGRFCSHCLLSFLVWTLWLGLTLLLAVQIYTACAHELAVPPFLLRALETRLAASGVKASFRRTQFDPSGRILIEDAQFTIASFDEPVVTARLLYMQVDPWALLAGRFEPRQLQASGVNFWIPAMLSATGRSESLLRDAEFTVSPTEHGIDLHQLTAHLGGLALTGHGSIDLAALRHERTAPLPLAGLLAQEYPGFCRKLAGLTQGISNLHAPSAALVFLPSANRGAIVRLALLADGFTAGDLTTGPLRLDTALPVAGPAPVLAQIQVEAASLELPNEVRAAGMRATVTARVGPADYSIAFRRAQVELRRLTASGFTMEDISARVSSARLPELDTALVARLGRQPLAVDGTVNVRTRSARLHAVGRFDPALLVPIGQRLGHNIRSFLDFASPPEFDLDVQFAPGGKFTQLAGRVAATQVFGKDVTFDRIGGHIEFDGRHFIATQAEASVDGNFARGSFEQDLVTKGFRFLLTGRLRPLAISPWFREWWPDFWHHFDFTAAAPDAAVDVQGRWFHGPETSVFVFADCPNPVVRGVPLDHATTLIYLRPHYYDAMEFHGTQGAGAVQGNFTLRLSDEGFSLKRADFDLDSSVSLKAIGDLVGPQTAGEIAAFKFERPPHLRARGFVAGDEGSAATIKKIEIEGSAAGAFTYHNFPLENLSFHAALDHNGLAIDPLTVGFAHGTANGKIRLNGQGADQQLGFDLNLKDANLRQAADTLTDYVAKGRKDAVPAAANYIQREANVTLDLGLSAEGRLADRYSFVGTGNAELSGRGLGEIRLLGLLSELLNFTSLRFNNLRTNFSIDKDKLVFPEISITGANTAISAHGQYTLDGRSLDFYARVYPFQESTFFVKSLVGVVLTPLSTVLEVKLTGKLDKPAWAFVMGPTNFLRNLIQPIIPESKPATQTPSSPAPKG